jgi:MFS family permease
LYFGAFVGYILFSFYSDNYGRRIALLVAFSIATIGTIIMVCSFNLPVVALGLFLLGAGADAAINMTFNYLGEVV